MTCVCVCVSGRSLLAAADIYIYIPYSVACNKHEVVNHHRAQRDLFSYRTVAAVPVPPAVSHNPALGAETR